MRLRISAMSIGRPSAGGRRQGSGRFGNCSAHDAPLRRIKQTERRSDDIMRNKQQDWMVKMLFWNNRPRLRTCCMAADLRITYAHESKGQSETPARADDCHERFT